MIPDNFQSQYERSELCLFGGEAPPVFCVGGLQPLFWEIVQA